MRIFKCIKKYHREAQWLHRSVGWERKEWYFKSGSTRPQVRLHSHFLCIIFVSFMKGFYINQKEIELFIYICIYSRWYGLLTGSYYALEREAVSPCSTLFSSSCFPLCFIGCVDEKCKHQNVLHGTYNLSCP